MPGQWKGLAPPADHLGASIPAPIFLSLLAAAGQGRGESPGG